MDLNDKVADAALGWVGTPYRHQASVRGAGADCLGVIRGLWREVIGPEPELPPEYTMDWDEVAGGEVLARVAARWLLPMPPIVLFRGAVLLFRMRDGAVAKHLGVVTQAGAAPRFVHAYSGHGVMESPLSAPWARRVAGVYAFPEGV